MQEAEVYRNVEQWIEIRRRVLNGEISQRQACREYDLYWQTLQRIFFGTSSAGARKCGPPRSPKLDPFRPVIECILDADRATHRKQRHTDWRIFERLRDEHGYIGSYTLVKDALWDMKLSRREVFLPLRHDPGEAQVDFGFCYVDLAGQRQHVAVFVLPLPYCDAVYCQAFPRECSEVFLEGHRLHGRYGRGVRLRDTPLQWTATPTCLSPTLATPPLCCTAQRMTTY